MNPYLDGAVDFNVDTIRPVIVAGNLTQIPTQNESGINERVARYYGTEGPNGIVNQQKYTDTISKTGDGTSVDFTLTFRDPLHRNPNYYNANLVNADQFPDYDIRFATSDDMEVRFASAPSDGASLNFKVYVEV